MGGGEAPLSDVWDRRLRRAEELERLWPHAAEILRFYRVLAGFQRALSREGIPDARSLHDIRMKGAVDRLLRLVRQEGPPALAQQAAELLERREGEREPDDRESGKAGAFFLRVILQSRTNPPSERPGDESPGRCPACGGDPGVGVHREDREAETLRRSLVCSVCLAEWDFPRVLCPACKEERPEKLPRFTAEEIPWIRVEACDTCGKYLKAVDLSKEPAAEPVVDELASTPLDLLAREQGFEKIAPNLVGL